MQLRLAWRNIWRNPRRTGVILAAIAVGVWSNVFLGALMRGMVVQMVDNGIQTLTGDIQIHADGYRADPVVTHRIDDPDAVDRALRETLPGDALWTRRVRSPAVADTARQSAGVELVGIDPEREPDVSFIGPEAVAEGRYLRPDGDRGALVGAALLDKLEIRVGQRLVLMAQDSSGELASRAFEVVGSYRAELEATEKQFVFVAEPAARDMLGLDGSISEVCVLLADHDRAEETAARVRSALPDELEVHAWPQLLPILQGYLEIWDGFMALWYVMVFVAMGFGIVNTMLMAVMERMREFGLLKALGVGPWGIVRGIVTESAVLIAVGMVAGNLLGLLSVWALAGPGIDLSAMAQGMEHFGMSHVIYPVIAQRDLLTANGVVLVLGIVVSVYPAARAASFTAVEALAAT